MKYDPNPILGPDGLVARRLKSFEHRAQQLEMAEAVGRAIEGKSHLIAEAGTGVGKSFAYLAPAILAAARDGLRVVISTQTIALQEQLLRKDIPFLRSVLPEEFSAVLVKGRGNYVSLRRLAGARAKASQLFARYEEVQQVERLGAWAGESEDGSRSELEFRPLGSVWDEVASENGNCLGRSCPTYKDCFFYRARRRVYAANILVVNHALYMSDLALRRAGSQMLPDHDVVIFDEAHSLEAVAGDHLGAIIGNAGIEYLLGRLLNARGDKGLLITHEAPPEALEQVESARLAARAFFADAEREIRRAGTSNGRLRAPLDLPDTLGEELRKVSSQVDLLARSIGKPEEAIELEAASERCRATAAGLSSWLQQSEPDSVYWLEAKHGPRPRIALARAPLDVGPVLREQLFGRVPTCILTSATLAVGQPPGFSFLRGRLGLEGGEAVQLDSPFDYKAQAALHLVRGLPDPSTQAREFERRAILAIPRYLEMTRGKAFVLFTSHAMLERAARELGPWFDERGIRLLAQGEGVARNRLIDEFTNDVESVLFGTDTFWQGVDVPGEALSNVIIVKLPFSVPDRPLLEARLERIRERGGNPFTEYQVPEAAIKLKQGFGRLIRSGTDRGIVVILDPRTLTKPYGRTLLDSLPPCPRVVDPPPAAS